MQNGLPKEITFQGVTCSLAHLAPFTHVLIGQGKDKEDPKDKADLTVRIVFQSHVFSQAAKQIPHDFLDEGGKKRTFCKIRYSFSTNLPDICKTMLINNVLTWDEKDSNGSANLAVITPVGAPLTSGRYDVVIYYLIPSKVEGIDVELIVKTCYEKEINFEYRRKRERIIKYVKEAYYKGHKIPKN